MIIDVVDTRARKLVFRDIGTAVIGRPDGSARKIEKAATKMLETLPTKR